MRAGKLRWRLLLQRPEKTRDDYGEESLTFVNVAEVLCGDEALSLRGTAAVLGVESGSINAPVLRWLTIRHRGDIAEEWQVVRQTGDRAGIPMTVIAVRDGERPDEMNLIARYRRV
ncbi:phage head completion protein [Stenotrophomonas maltophilia]|uniref:phage head completion protein n=1 Tax=Stenotrophomonas maltophilia TaxID=40324 RepID=UPI000A30006E|nr:hypothetical protein [Stenotrophomonas maltophilia]ARQ90474.1 hypothetical protein A7326_13070 [Stenotrophomonas maltophilia]